MSKKTVRNIRNKWDKPRRIIDKIDSSKISELFSISTQMDTFALKQFSNINKIPLSVSKNDGTNLIHEIVSSDDETKGEDLRLNVIKFLVSEGVSPDSPNSDNNTALHFACSKQYTKIIKYLLEQGANPNYGDNVAMTPFHYLLAGEMKLCPPSRRVKDFIPLTKKTNKHKIDNLKDMKKKIWDEIKNDPIVKSLRDTIIETELPPKINDYLKDFEVSLTNILKDNDQNDLQQLRELVEPFKTQLRNWITKQFGDFKKIDNFEIHPKKETSWAKFKNSELATIKNHNTSDYVKTEIKKAASIIESLNFDEIFQNDEEVDMTDVYRILINTINQVGGDYKKFENKLFKYGIYDDDTTKMIKKIIVEDFNQNVDDEIRHHLAEDNDDNMINWNMGTYVGGRKDLKINFEKFNFDEIFNKNVNDKNDNDKNYQAVIDNILKNQDKSSEIIKLIKSNVKINTIYSNIMNNINKVNDLTLYLISGIANYTTNLRLSIFNAMKIKYIDEIFNDDKKNYFYRWIRLLMSTEIQDIQTFKYEYQDYKFDDQLEPLIEFSKEIFNKKFNLNLKDDKFSWIPSVKNEKIPNTEKLINGIVDYYDRMDQKPLKQHIAFTINIIRLFERDKKLLEDQDKINEYINEKFKLLNPANILNKKIKKIYKPKFEKTYYDDFKNVFDKKESKSKLPSKDEEKIDIPFNYYHSKVFPPGIINVDITDDYEIKKFLESYCLGLIYIGTIRESSESKFSSNFKKFKNVEIVIKKNIMEDDNVDSDDFKVPTINSYINTILRQIIRFNNQRDLVLENLKEIMKELPKGSKNYAKILPVHLTTLNSLTLNINFLIDVLKQEENHEIENELEYQIYKSYDFIEIKDNKIKIKFKNKSIINQIVNSLNRINGLYYIYYYIKKKNYTNKNEIKIPQFFYDIIPNDSTKRQFRYYDEKGSKLMNLKGGAKKIYSERLAAAKGIADEVQQKRVNDRPESKEEDSDDEGIDDKGNDDKGSNDGSIGNFNFNISSSYDDLLDMVRKGKNFIMEKKIGEALIRNPENSLPPSVLPLYSEFYKLNMIELVKKLDDENIIDDIDINLKIENLKISNEHLKHLIVEELVSESLKFIIDIWVQNTYSKIISGVSLGEEDSENFNDELPLITISKEFEESINFNSIDQSFKYFENLYKNNTNKILLNFYKTSQDPEKKDEFRIYPNDYTTTYLLKSYYCLKVEKKGIDYLLKYYAKYNLKDLENNTPVHLLIKNYYAKPLKKLKQYNLDFGSRSIKRNHKIPFYYMIEEYYNHSIKFNNGFNNRLSIYKFFTNNQYKEIETMIYANEDFGNNVIRNLRLSYHIVMYILQRYLTLHMLLFKDDFKSLKIDLSNNNDFLDFIKANITTSNIFLKDKNLVAHELRKDLNDILDNLSDEIIKKSTIAENSDEENIKNYYNYKGEKIKKLANDLSLNKIDLDNIDKINFEKKINNSQSFSLVMDQGYDIIKNLEDKLLNNEKIFDKNHGSYINSFERFFENNEFNEGTNNLFIDMSLLDSVISKGLLTGEFKLNQIKEYLKKFHKIYNNVSKIPLEYFEGSKYTSENDVRKFCEDLMIHMTKNIICHDLEMIIRKILYQHFQQTFPESDGPDIIRKIDHVLRSENKDFKTGRTILDVLYQDVAPKFVKNSINFYKDKYDEQTSDIETTKEILENFFELFTITEPIKINKQDNVYQIFNNQIINYFDTVTSKIIINWLVVIENQFKFLINQERILDCVTTML